MSTLNERRRSSGGKIGAVFNSIRRVSLGRRGSSDKDLPTQASLAQPVARRPSMDSIASESNAGNTSVMSPSLASDVSSLVAPVQKLNSSSPASELPKTWAEWNFAYQNGFIDFNDPPPPPTDLRSSEFATITGQFRAPFPANEAKRQRAVDNLGLSFNHDSGARKRRASVKGPKDEEILPPPVPPPAYKEQLNVATPAEKIPPAYPARDTSDHSELDEAGAAAEAAAGAFTKMTKRQEGPMHPALEKLAIKAKQRFGVDATTVSLMDRDDQVFLSDSDCSFLREADTVPRELTCCSHAMLKASTGTKDPLVVLDFAQDWRFSKNGFGDYKSGFYAAAPIMLPAPMGDDAGEYPAGIFCLLGEKPRVTFSDSDRDELKEFADEASLELQKYAAQQRKERQGGLAKKRKEWKKSKLVRRVSGQPGLDTVEELPTPPMTPDLGGLDITSAEDQAEDELFAQADEQTDGPRRPSLADSIGSDGSAIDLQTISTTPVFGSGSGRPGVLAASPKAISTEIQSVLDLSTQLVAESIEMDFAYVLSVDIPAAKAAAASSADASKSSKKSAASSASPLRLVSVHGMPIPPPLFSIDMHLEALLSERSALLFVNDKFSGGDGEFSTGLLVKIAIKDDTGYILGCFSEDSRRILNTEDLLFLRSFGRDLAKYTPDL
ncbi:hypothetical protein JCM10207_005313 [Rhodosporidiobolus poonsookiae]